MSIYIYDLDPTSGITIKLSPDTRTPAVGDTLCIDVDVTDAQGLYSAISLKILVFHYVLYCAVANKIVHQSMLDNIMTALVVSTLSPMSAPKTSYSNIDIIH